ncbi:MAG: hypothetical protein IJL74_02990 [Bacilli bacterium]|nr:hypothetical protein [Bacilli bacterium]
MKLVTFQTIEAVKDLFNKGYLECDEKKINFDKNSSTYNWIVENMNKRIDNPNNTK